MSIGNIFLVLFLFIYGLVTLLQLTFQGQNLVLGLLALAAAVAMCLGGVITVNRA